MTIGFSARSEKYDSTKNVTMIGLWSQGCVFCMMRNVLF
jgi:hypothetical protein